MHKENFAQGKFYSALNIFFSGFSTFILFNRFFFLIKRLEINRVALLESVHSATEIKPDDNYARLYALKQAIGAEIVASLFTKATMHKIYGDAVKSHDTAANFAVDSRSYRGRSDPSKRVSDIHAYVQMHPGPVTRNMRTRRCVGRA